MMNFVTSIIKKYIQNEFSEEPEHTMINPVDLSNKENGFNQPEIEPTKDESLQSTESIVTKTKPRFSILQEFDPLCACKETVEDPDITVPDDDFKDAHSIPEKSLLDADETEAKIVSISVSDESSESTPTLTDSVENIEPFVAISTEEIVEQIEHDQSFKSISNEETINTQPEESALLNVTIDNPEQHNTSADTTQYLDTLSTVADETILISESTDKEGGKSEEISETESIRLAAIRSISLISDSGTKKIMSDLTEKMEEQQQEISELKLQLNASQQARASLELELTQKDEVILKTQAELLKIEQSHKQELKLLKEELKENSKLIQKGGCKDLEEKLKECKAREARAVAELSQKLKDILSYTMSMEQYERQLSKLLKDHSLEVEEHEITKRHLASLELAFSDVHSKYEKTKEVIQGYVMREEALVTKLELSLATNLKHEEKYESLKTHAKNQIDKSNMEILSLREKDESELSKLRAIIKRLEIKCGSLEVALQQKSEECQQLAALCDEVTGKRV